MVNFPRQQQFKQVPTVSPARKGTRYGNLNYFLPLKNTFHGIFAGNIPLTDNTVRIEQQIIKLDYVPPGSQVNFLLCGTASFPGVSNFDAVYQPAAGGEVGWYSAVLDGTETYMILEQRGIARKGGASDEPFMRLSFVGQTTKYMDVGSAKGTPNNTYGASGCPFSRGNTTTGWPGITVNKYGAVRCVDDNIFYTDATNYAANGSATYGTTTYSDIDIAGMKVRAYFGDKTSTFDSAAQYPEPAHNSVSMNTGISILDFNRGGLSSQMYGFAGVETTLLVGSFRFLRYGYASQYAYSSGAPFGNNGNIYAHNFGCAIVEIVRNRGALGVTAS